MPRRFGHENLPALGSRIRALREGRRWSLKRLAAESGVSVAALQKIEQGAANPSILTILALVEALGEPIDRLIESARDTGRSIRVTRAGEATQPIILGPGKALALQNVTRDVAQPRMQALIADFSPGSSTDGDRLDLSASLFCFVLKGGIRASLPEGDAAELKSGDALHAFDRPPSALSNPYQQPARLICVRDADQVQESRPKTKAGIPT